MFLLSSLLFCFSDVLFLYYIRLYVYMVILVWGANVGLVLPDLSVILCRLFQL